MTTIYDVDQTELVEKTAQALKQQKLVIPPEWATFVKTGMSKERPPVNPDWWYVRAASVLKKVYALGPVGVSKLRTLYGGKKNRGYKTEHFYKGSGSILRKILQQLQKAGLVKFTEKGIHKGRVLTPSGIKLLERAATEINTRKVQIAVKEVRPEEKPAKEISKEQKEPAKDSPKEVSKTKAPKNG